MTFGPLELSVPRGRLRDATGEREWKSASLPAYKRLSHRAEALIAQALPGRHEHPPGTPGAGQPVRRPCRQGRGQPRLAADPFGLGDVAEARSRRRGHRPAEPGRHRRQGPARPKVTAISLLSARHPPRRAEGGAGDQEHGRRERGRVAPAARRSHGPRHGQARAGRRRRRQGALGLRGQPAGRRPRLNAALFTIALPPGARAQAVALVDQGLLQ